ncbi:glycosyltransferase [Phyllobacterium sp. 0TCS1.6C]|uniref:glycosyltransferase family 2 protein n=1 Tax=unclassified Phyllobacterium TaxID=2638441 RepID=UPI002264F536|nr:MULTISPECIES: glycosyltransferase [unclassified Phyllobacterium]MCX8281995.1 glycosyltransferase [Phyllobacterium sp. 0TCS1.6C]MCX8294458.1 glycosyltransferase [Phyllobacterium sp. 0TCS1.6A]
MQLPDNISIVAQSPGLEPEKIEVVVTLPTFKRPEHLLKTLASLEAQQTRRRFAVIVMENEAERREGAAAALELFAGGKIPGLLIIAHDRGNCNAYNAGWRTALAVFPRFSSLVVIDDDEIADPNWLENLCATREAFGVDFVGGPQIPIFARKEHQSFASHPVFRPHYSQTGPVPILYSSGNLLIGRNVLEAMPFPFLDLAFNFMGGGDSDFIDRSVRRGFRLAWCAEAPVYETVPERRVEASWIRARALRNGVISSLIERRKHAGGAFGRTKTTLKSLALLAASPARGAVAALKSGSLSIGAYPIYIGLGRVLADFGYSNEQYRQPEKN